jgi:hypothetical protein
VTMQSMWLNNASSNYPVSRVTHWPVLSGTFFVGLPTTDVFGSP